MNHDACVDRVYCILHRFPPLYPHQPVSLRLGPVGPAEGEPAPAALPPHLIRGLMHKLNAVAAEHAKRGEVCVFELVSQVTDALQDQNVPPEGCADDGQQVPESLWHEMQRRTTQGQDAPTTSAEDAAILGIDALYGGSQGYDMFGGAEEANGLEGAASEQQGSQCMMAGGLFDRESDTEEEAVQPAAASDMAAACTPLQQQQQQRRQQPLARQHLQLAPSTQARNPAPEHAGAPTNAPPTKALPTNALPIRVLPTNAPPPTALPRNASPTSAPPLKALPGNASPTSALPTNALPQNAAPDHSPSSTQPSPSSHLHQHTAPTLPSPFPHPHQLAHASPNQPAPPSTAATCRDAPGGPSGSIAIQHNEPQRALPSCPAQQVPQRKKQQEQHHHHHHFQQKQQQQQQEQQRSAASTCPTPHQPLQHFEAAAASMGLPPGLLMEPSPDALPPHAYPSMGAEGEAKGGTSPGGAEEVGTPKACTIPAQELETGAQKHAGERSLIQTGSRKKKRSSPAKREAASAKGPGAGSASLDAREHALAHMPKALRSLFCTSSRGNSSDGSKSSSSRRSSSYEESSASSEVEGDGRTDSSSPSQKDYSSSSSSSRSSSSSSTHSNRDNSNSSRSSSACGDSFGSSSSRNRSCVSQPRHSCSPLRAEGTPRADSLSRQLYRGRGSYTKGPAAVFRMGGSSSSRGGGSSRAQSDEGGSGGGKCWRQGFRERGVLTGGIAGGSSDSSLGGEPRGWSVPDQLPHAGAGGGNRSAGLGLGSEQRDRQSWRASASSRSSSKGSSCSGSSSSGSEGVGLWQKGASPTSPCASGSRARPPRRTPSHSPPHHAPHQPTPASPIASRNRRTRKQDRVQGTDRAIPAYKGGRSSRKSPSAHAAPGKCMARAGRSGAGSAMGSGSGTKEGKGGQRRAKEERGRGRKGAVFEGRSHPAESPDGADSRRELGSIRSGGRQHDKREAAKGIASREAQRKKGTPGSQDLRLHLLLGHLLVLATTGGLAHGLPSQPPPGLRHTEPAAQGALDAPNPLPAIVEDLRKRRLLPRWIATLLMTQPAWFETAFHKQFSEEISSSTVALPSYARQFWSPRPSPCHSMSGVHAGSRKGTTRGAALEKMGHAGPESAPAQQGPGNAAKPGFVSRYRSDFKDEQLLGKGGFGLVVAATNVLDGLRYAIKKIKLTDAPMIGSSRILREVHTLSRLQHPNVVRYFQAWAEPIPPEEQHMEGAEGDDDGGEWGAFTSMPAETPSLNSPLDSSRRERMILSSGLRGRALPSHISEESSHGSTIIFGGGPSEAAAATEGVSEYQVQKHGSGNVLIA
ncbi:hypothetical protein DUNSADRAFT_2516 [Dunaliella salina]|uniref:Protein kinase domain-containing protein n=1 Tax=Dunaliella salina TaxID=3046 RepID=A0ABQ7GVI1_DUNSA|nr:hypothetical protein DUNSADRAFT_2516 [Dunaliella salina]|eukprot:KAF5838607.1 hypothetical protein DUNSADRAFT_2516 [Dunaliella salina]